MNRIWTKHAYLFKLYERKRDESTYCSHLLKLIFTLQWLPFVLCMFCHHIDMIILCVCVCFPMIACNAFHSRYIILYIMNYYMMTIMFLLQLHSSLLVAWYNCTLCVCMYVLYLSHSLSPSVCVCVSRFHETDYGSTIQTITWLHIVSFIRSLFIQSQVYWDMKLLLLLLLLLLA